MNIIQKIENEHLRADHPRFRAGDTVKVHTRIIEGEKERIQVFQGVVLRLKKGTTDSTFIVRKVSSGEGVERTFQTYSPLVAAIEVKRRGDVRRAKLYYLRQRSGKSARIKEKLTRRQR